MHYKLTRLLLLPTAGKPTTTAEIFIANPPIDQESLLGKLFFIAEIETTKPGARKFIEFLGNALANRYYRADQISMREKMGTLQIAEIFERALAHVNTDIELFLKRERIKIPAKEYHLTAGVVHGSRLAFSVAGSMKGLLIYPDTAAAGPYEDEDTKRRYKLTPLYENNESETKVRLEKFFSNLTEGAIPPEGYVIFTNDILPEYVTNKHLTKIVTTLPPLSAVEQLKNQLHKINNYVTFVGLIIKSSRTPHVKRTIPQLNINVTAHNSLERMQETESETARYLSPAGTVPLRKFWGTLYGAMDRLRPRRAVPQVSLRDKIFFAKKGNRAALAWLQAAGNRLGAIAGAGMAGVIAALRNPHQLMARLRQAGASFLYAFVSIARWLVRLSPLHKGLLVVFFIAIGLFGFNLYRQTADVQQVADQARYQALLQTVKEQHNRVYASLVYRNDEGARAALQEAQATLAELVTVAGENNGAVAQLRAEQQGYLDQLSNVVVVSGPAEVAAVSQPATRLLLTETDLIAFAPQSTAVTVISRADAGQAGEHNLAAPAVAGARLDGATAAVVSATDGLRLADGTATELTGAFERAGERIAAAASYNSRLYTLDTAQNNIWRHAASLTSKERWLKETADLADARDVAIDGYIYVAFGDGTIRQYLSGYESEFELAEAMPVLAAVDRLALTGTSETGFIYALERSNKRIVVFDKTGAFVIQYRFDTLSSVEDFAVSDDDTQGYVLNAGKIYSFGMEHTE